MDSLSYKTVSINKATANKQWVLIDAQDQVLGRLSSKVAKLLRGKYKTEFTPHVDCGDNVIIINAEKVKLTGNKLTEKQYVRYTGYPGGQRFATPTEVLAKHPERVIEKAVHGMIPKNKLGAAVERNLFIYAGDTHPHTAQNPTLVNLNNLK